MKFVYFIILALVVFNGILILSSGIFSVYTPGYENVPDYSKYKLTNSTNVVDYFFNDTFGLAAGACLMVGGVIIALLTKNYVIIGMGMFLGLVTTLYIGATGVIFQVYPDDYIRGVIAIVGVAIGILLLYNVTEMFTGQGGDA